MNQNRSGAEKSFGSFHLRQAFGLFVASVALSVVISILMRITSSLTYLNEILSLVVLVFAILGILSANKGEEKELSIIGEYIEKNFGKLFV